MTEERWDEIKKMAKSYVVLEEKTEPILIKTGLTDDSQKKIGDKEVIVFESPAGKIKLEYSTKPVVLEKKEHYTHRAGAAAQTEYVLSDTEFVHTLKAFRWTAEIDDWQAIDAKSFQ